MFGYFYVGSFKPDYVIEFVIACPVFTGSVAIARKSGCLEILV
ncbi:hypothetical protein Cycma_3136 [Cyclobacterium marinum DSM 745]|uniref:Uncharacterized protein n=1 Tax=Cyclobacterium marinum (strain ATCC 25205 / DSM 745 / LMG 13164 / NCIMB 1802) TaxID=880070 RepID=G0J6B2_CYCMS|nr:hypothetical protein Cycma_3136 [Cyclobacterium marinum DSM 745]